MIDEMIGIKLEPSKSYEFAINNSKVEVAFPVEIKESKVAAENLRYYPMSVFTFYLYHRPARVILAAYFPMFVLACVLLSVYAGPYDLNARVANIGVVLMAYVSFIPSLRAVIPPTPYYTLSDYTLYSNLIACLLTLISSVLLYTNVSSQAALNDPWSEKTITNFTYSMTIITGVFLFIPYVIVLFLTLKHYSCLQRKYDTPRVSVKRDGQNCGENKDWFIPNQDKLA